MTDDILKMVKVDDGPALAQCQPAESKRPSPDEHVDELQDKLAPLASAERDTRSSMASTAAAPISATASGTPRASAEEPVSPASVAKGRRISFHLYDKEGDDSEANEDVVDLPAFLRAAPNRVIRRLVSAPGAAVLHQAGGGRVRTVSENDIGHEPRVPSHASTVPAFAEDLKSSAEDVLGRLSPGVLPKQRVRDCPLAYEHRRVHSAAVLRNQRPTTDSAHTADGSEPSVAAKPSTATGTGEQDEKPTAVDTAVADGREGDALVESALRTAIEDSDAFEKKNVSAKRRAKLMAQLSFGINVLLLSAKTVATLISGSYSIISSLVDSVVDLTSGGVIWYTERAIRDPYEYPRGRTRLEPLALVVISVVMAVASIQVIVQSTEAIISGGIELDVSPVAISLMVATVFAKFILMVLCRRAAAAGAGDASCTVLAQDHRNDCISNSVAIACAIIGDRLWVYADPIGAILVSIYIVVTWFNTGYEQIVMLSGKSAPPDLINRIVRVCLMHDPRVISIDTVLVYHFGSKFLVEVHIVLDGEMSLRESHDLSEPLQNKIEALDWVERAFVHNDYDTEHRPEDEHKIV